MQWTDMAALEGGKAQHRTWQHQWRHRRGIHANTPIQSWVWDLQFTSIEREDERTLHGWIAALLPWTELEVIAKRGDRT
jgi:hypothetical protein